MSDLLAALGEDPDFAAVWDVWNAARRGAMIPRYRDVHLEMLGERVSSVSVFKWAGRNSMTYVLHGKDLFEISGVDLTGENLFDNIHESRVEAVRDFDETIAMTPCIGLSEFSVHMKSGLTTQRRMCIFPATSADPGCVYMIALVKNMTKLNYSPIEIPVEYCRTQFDARVFEIEPAERPARP